MTELEDMSYCPELYKRAIDDPHDVEDIGIMELAQRLKVDLEEL